MTNAHTGIDNANIGRLVEDSLAALTEVDARIQALRAGLLQAVPALANQGQFGNPAAIAGSPMGLGLGNVGFGNLAFANPGLNLFGNPAMPNYGTLGGVPFTGGISPMGANVTTAFVPTPQGLIPVTVPVPSPVSAFGNIPMGLQGVSPVSSVSPFTFGNPGGFGQVPFRGSTFPSLGGSPFFGASFRGPFGTPW